MERWLKYYKPNYKIQAQFLSLCKEENVSQVFKVFKGKKLHPLVEYNLAMFLKKVGLLKESSEHLNNINFESLKEFLENTNLNSSKI